VAGTIGLTFSPTTNYNSATYRVTNPASSELSRVGVAVVRTAGVLIAAKLLIIARTDLLWPVIEAH
jgi:hypothetical protein